MCYTGFFLECAGCRALLCCRRKLTQCRTCRQRCLLQTGKPSRLASPLVRPTPNHQQQHGNTLTHHTSMLCSLNASPRLTRLLLTLQTTLGTGQEHSDHKHNTAEYCGWQGHNHSSDTSISNVAQTTRLFEQSAAYCTAYLNIAAFTVTGNLRSC